MGRLSSLLLACTLAAPAGSAAREDSRGQERGPDFWRGLVRECSVPPGETASGLVSEAVSLLGSKDSFWRDDVGYGVVAACVYQKRALDREQRRQLTEELTANLSRGIGESGTDSVLRRSFSALDLSVLTALELEDPALDQAGYRRLLEAALVYLRDERDLRGLEPGMGWIHATAHTADLLKFLARDRRFTAKDQSRLLDAAWTKLTARGTAVFTHTEDERLAAALCSVVRRADFDAAAFQQWLVRFPSLEAEVWTASPPRPAVLDAAQNARNLLRSLFVALSLPAPASPGVKATAPPPGEAAAREAVLQVLRRINR